MLHLIVILSGALSLIYQIAWIRGLTLILGTTTTATITVLCTFMAGLSFGSFLYTHFKKHIHNPLRVYALLESVISLCAFCSPYLLGFFASIAPELLPSLVFSGESMLLVRIILSIILLGIPTLCMGASLPVLCQHLSLRSKRVDAKISLLYACNTFGASIGCLLAGYFILPLVGLTHSLLLSSGINAALALTLQLISRKTTVEVTTRQKVVHSVLAAPRTSSPLVLCLAVIVGSIGLMAELVWTRILVMTVGGSIYTFSTLLGVFLFGYGLGALCGSLLLRKLDFSRATLVLYLYLIALLLSIQVSVYVTSLLPDLYIAHFDYGYTKTAIGLLKLQLYPSILVMGAPSVCLGLFFPCALFFLDSLNCSTPNNTARLYTWNTFGAIVGAVITSVVIVPRIGLAFSISSQLSILVALTLIYWYVHREKLLSRALAVPTIAAIFVPFFTPSLDPHLLSAGTSAYAMYFKDEAQSSLGVLDVVQRDQTLLFYKDGYTAGVSVSSDDHSPEKDLLLSTNGKIDGSSNFDMPTQKLLAHIPALVHKNPKRACVIGFGTGTTAGSLALHPSIQTTVVEIEPAIVEAAELFERYNNRPLEQPNVTLVLNDARLHLQTLSQRYDIITSEPSNPWLAGVSDLFTKEFYELSSRSLEDDGIFVQWVQIYNIDISSFKLIVRTFRSIYPNSYLLSTIARSDVLLIGIKGHTLANLDLVSKRFNQSAVYKDLSSPNVNIHTVEELLARIILGPAQLADLTPNGRVNTDELPYLSYRAPLSLYRKTSVSNLREIVKFRAPISEILDLKSSSIDTVSLSEYQSAYFQKMVDIAETGSQ